VKPKDLLGAPWLLAFALRADGWYLRQCIIWHKPNAMPESVRDRCTTAHSYVFLLTKQPRYWFDADAIAEPFIGYDGRKKLIRDHAVNGSHSNYANLGRMQERWPGGPDGSRNARSVWTIPTSGYSEAHFATFPEALVERMLKAGCPEWVCAQCGKARERLIETRLILHQRVQNSSGPTGKFGTMGANRARDGHVSGHNETRTIGWSDCGCNDGFTPGVVLDPFGGAATTALVARRLGRRSVLIELNEGYCRMAARRLQQLSLLAELA